MTIPVEKNLQLIEEEEEKNNIDWPEAFIDPLSHKPFENPVMLVSDGHSYEKKNIEEWLKEHSTSPITGDKLNTTAFVENVTLLNAIKEYINNKTKYHCKKHNNYEKLKKKS